jgi:ATP-dependent RNA helicase RhlE
LIQNGIKSAAIHGNKSQGARSRALADFKQNKIRVLVATDIAARGLDISQLPHVINFELPNSPEDYVHRIGRTGRAGNKGVAISLVCNEEHKQLDGIERLLKHQIPRDIIEGYEPVHSPKPQHQHRTSGTQQAATGKFNNTKSSASRRRGPPSNHRQRGNKKSA